MFHIILLVAQFLGFAVFACIVYAGVHAIARQSIAKTSETIKNALAAKHVLQAIEEFKANHPEIAALYSTKK